MAMCGAWYGTVHGRKAHVCTACVSMVKNSVPSSAVYGRKAHVSTVCVSMPF